MENYSFKRLCKYCNKPLRKRPANWYKDFKERDSHIKCWKEEKKRKALLNYMKHILEKYE